MKKILSLLFFLLISCQPSSSTTISNLTVSNASIDASLQGQIILGGRASLSISNNTYGHIMGGATRYDTENYQIMPNPGTFSRFQVYLSESANAPGAGNSWTFTLIKNGASTAIATTISGTDRLGYDFTDSIHYNAGDTISVLVTSSGSPASGRAIWNIKFVPDDIGHTILLGSSGRAVETSGNITGNPGNHFQLTGNNGSETAANRDLAQIIPCDGTLKNFYFNQIAAPGSGTSWTFTVNKNGTDTSMAVTIADTNTSGTDLVNTVDVAAGDTFKINVTKSGSPASANSYWGVTFVPDDPQDFALIMSDPEIDSVSGTWTGAVEGILSGLIRPAVNGGTGRQQLGAAMSFKSIYAQMYTAPGGSDTFTFNLQKDFTNVGLQTIMSGANTTANTVLADNALVSVGDFSFLNTQIVATATANSMPVKVSYCARLRQ